MYLQQLNPSLFFPTEMMLLVNPTRVGVEEGASVSLQCIVLTDMPANTTIKWQINSGQVKTLSILYIRLSMA